MATISESSIVTKCGLVLDIFSEARRPLKFKDIATQSGLARSTTHRILTILINENLVTYDKVNKIYQYGPRLNRWARGAWMRIDLHESSATEMERLTDTAKMNSELSVLDVDSVLYLRTLNVFPTRYASQSGDHAPLHCTAAGKVFLAFMQEQQRDAILGRLRYERLTEYTLQRQGDLLDELEDTRKRGYGLAVREEYLTVMGIAVPIRNLAGEVIASLSLWTLDERNTLYELKAQAAALIASSERISRKAQN